MKLWGWQSFQFRSGHTRMKCQSENFTNIRKWEVSLAGKHVYRWFLCSNPDHCNVPAWQEWVGKSPHWHLRHSSPTSKTQEQNMHLRTAKYLISQLILTKRFWRQCLRKLDVNLWVICLIFQTSPSRSSGYETRTWGNRIMPLKSNNIQKSALCVIRLNHCDLEHM